MEAWEMTLSVTSWAHLPFPALPVHPLNLLAQVRADPPLLLHCSIHAPCLGMAPETQPEPVPAHPLLPGPAPGI